MIERLEDRACPVAHACACLLGGLLLLVLAGAAIAQPGAGRPARPIAPALRGQLDAIAAEKRARTPAQQKLDSELLYAARKRRGMPLVAGAPSLRSTLAIDGEGRAEVDLRGAVGPALLEAIESLGGTVTNAHPRFGRLRARVPILAVEALAARADVVSIRPAALYYTNQLDTSEGDVRHRADLLRSTFGVDGTGITVGVLSDGVDSLASLIGSGDLPVGTAALPGQAGSGSEGTAMLEIVFDLAPGATLLFATALGGEATFAANVLALRAAGADVIVDDLGYFAEGVFQDDLVAAAVADVVADGAAYFSAAGNSGNANDGTSGVWEGDFVDSGAGFNGRDLHSFAGSILNEITSDSTSVFSLHWSDPLTTAANDYDLYLVDTDGTTVIGASTTNQNGVGFNDDPYEQISSVGVDDAGRFLVIGLDSGAARYLHLNTNRGRLDLATNGQTSGHSAVVGAYSVAAVSALGIVGPFTGAESIDTYSSDGPRRVFFEEDGTPLTPGDFSATGGAVRAKPDLAAADCVSTATPGFSTFCGTSAAAPHAAAIAALLLEVGGPSIVTPTVLRSALESTALDIEAVGPDSDSGAGLIDALAAGQVLPECAIDLDCNDEAFCTGAETCVAGTCTSAGDPCTGGGQLCDETGDVCVDCLVDLDCDDGDFCTGAETCTAGVCDASPGDPCTGGGQLCDESGDVCVDCLVDLDCDDGDFCTGAETCTAGVCDASPGDPCTGGGQLCDESGDVCVDCLVDLDCDDGDFCTGAETCTAGVCDASPGDPCTGGGQLCDESGDVCVDCLVDLDCDDGSFCSGVETCTAGFCPGSTGNPCTQTGDLCDEAGDVCVACLGDPDCGPGQICSAGLCVLEVPAVPQIGIFVLALLVLASAGLAIVREA